MRQALQLSILHCKFSGCTMCSWQAPPQPVPLSTHKGHVLAAAGGGRVRGAQTRLTSPAGLASYIAQSNARSVMPGLYSIMMFSTCRGKATHSGDEAWRCQQKSAARPLIE